MKRYFTDFEFETGIKRYWLPLFISAANMESASDLSTAFKTALEARYKIIHSSLPILVIQEVNLDRIEEHVKHRFRGRIATLNAIEWQFADIPDSEEIAFDQRLGQAIHQGYFTLEGSVAKGQRRRFYVGVIHSKYFGDLDEILIIDLVLPVEK